MYVLSVKKVKAGFPHFYRLFKKKIVVHYLHNNTSTSHYVCTYYECISCRYKII